MSIIKVGVEWAPGESTSKRCPRDFAMQVAQCPNVDRRSCLIFFIITIIGPTVIRPEKVNYRQREKQILDEILNSTSYDIAVRPLRANVSDDLENPTYVTVDLHIRSIDEIDENAMGSVFGKGNLIMEYSVELFLRLGWLDERLAFQKYDPPPKLRFLKLTDPLRVWKPDLYFSNEKRSHFHEMWSPNLFIRISPNGEVFYSARITLTLSCRIILILFPMDIQTCSLTMETYGSTTEDLIYQWKVQDNPVGIASGVSLAQFQLMGYNASAFFVTTNTGTYSNLGLDIHLTRYLGYYIFQIYIPTAMFVIVSWVSFWLDPGSVAERLSLVVTILLTLVTQIAGITQTLPKVSYTKALDVWNRVCLSFVFGAILEIGLANYASRSDKQRGSIKDQVGQEKLDLEQGQEIQRNFRVFSALGSGDRDTSKEHEMQNEKVLKKQGCSKTWLSKFPSRAQRIDLVARIGFPLVFVLFNLVYWTAYLPPMNYISFHNNYANNA